MDGRVSKICLSGVNQEQLISPCMCSGSIQHVHKGCLAEWRLSSRRNFKQCDICNHYYQTNRTCCESILIYSITNNRRLLLWLIFLYNFCYSIYNMTTDFNSMQPITFGIINSIYYQDSTHYITTILDLLIINFIYACIVFIPYVYLLDIRNLVMLSITHCYYKVVIESITIHDIYFDIMNNWNVNNYLAQVVYTLIFHILCFKLLIFIHNQIKYKLWKDLVINDIISVQ